MSAAVAVILAVVTANFGGDGWESNPPRTPQQRPANGFEDPCGRVEYRTGPKGPLTQRSINRLGSSLIVFSEPGHVTSPNECAQSGCRPRTRWGVCDSAATEPKQRTPLARPTTYKDGGRPLSGGYGLAQRAVSVALTEAT